MSEIWAGGGRVKLVCLRPIALRGHPPRFRTQSIASPSRRARRHKRGGLFQGLSTLPHPAQPQTHPASERHAPVCSAAHNLRGPPLRSCPGLASDGSSTFVPMMGTWPPLQTATLRSLPSHAACRWVSLPGSSHLDRVRGGGGLAVGDWIYWMGMGGGRGLEAGLRLSSAQVCEPSTRIQLPIPALPHLRQSFASLAPVRKGKAGARLRPVSG